MKALLGSVLGFLAVWWGYFYLVSHWPFGPDTWSEPEVWVLRGLTLTTVVVSLGVGIVCGAYVSTRTKSDSDE